MEPTPQKSKIENTPISKPNEPLPHIFETARHTGFSTAKLRRSSNKKSRRQESNVFLSERSNA